MDGTVVRFSPVFLRFDMNRVEPMTKFFFLGSAMLIELLFFARVL